ncbi:MAG: hypothetical protein A3K19_22225 [Lentisphaerae bacterium RIFOXYB12_FULL_65_16]|nr:MAG: hypothetical protein A3K18_21345 [Lentisphaerae bacterium RIFOXYA12_64_32]OGV93579.1 MAG: hypothetical protein A3K19_22225 [Lentisphaerae bacterium RIFOXYB12_FULL_65_16]
MSQEQPAREIKEQDQDGVTAYHALLESIEHHADPKSNTVLVVDDSRLVRRAVVKSITAHDSRVVIFEAEDGQQGLERLQEIRRKYLRDPLFIVTDLEMPVMDGWQLIDHLRQDYESRNLAQGIPVIVLSSSTGEKGSFFFRKSVHGGKSHYNPLVSIAKDACLAPQKYDGVGEQGLKSWIKFFATNAAKK